MPNVSEIVIQYLKKNGFDGLFNVDAECGCDLEDFAPCCDLGIDCEPGFKVPCDCGGHDFHISREKPEEKDREDETDPSETESRD